MERMARADTLPQETQDEANRIIGLILNESIALHRKYGPFMLERFYQELLQARLVRQGLRVEREVPIKVVEEGVAIDLAFRADLVVNESVLVELKAAKESLAIWNQQVLTYMGLARLHYGVLVNFGMEFLKDGFRRFVL